jgi:hypothetical protein
MYQKFGDKYRVLLVKVGWVSSSPFLAFLDKVQPVHTNIIIVGKQ